MENIIFGVFIHSLGRKVKSYLICPTVRPSLGQGPVSKTQTFNSTIVCTIVCIACYMVSFLRKHHYILFMFMDFSSSIFYSIWSKYQVFEFNTI